MNGIKLGNSVHFVDDLCLIDDRCQICLAGDERAHVVGGLLFLLLGLINFGDVFHEESCYHTFHRPLSLLDKLISGNILAYFRWID